MAHIYDTPDLRAAPGLLSLEIDAEEVGLRRPARTDIVVRRHTRRYIVLIDQMRAGNPREIRFVGQATVTAVVPVKLVPVRVTPAVATVVPGAPDAGAIESAPVLP